MSLQPVQSKSRSKLIWLLFMHRHGDRTPLNMAPRDKYNNISYWPEGFGNLDNHGRSRMFKLGKFIRTRYNDFFGNNMRQLYARSSDVERCIESSLAVLSGIYTPRNEKIWNKDLLWMPVPVHTYPPDSDYLLNEAGAKVVEKISTELIKIQNESDLVKKLYQDSVKERELLGHEIGNTFDHFINFRCAYSCLDIEERNGYEMPTWYTPELKKKLYDFAGVSFSLAASGTERLLKLRSCCLLKDMLDRMTDAKIEDSNVEENLAEFAVTKDHYNRKIVHYSTHDSVMAVMLDALKINGSPNPIPPSFGATLFFELYVDVDEKGNQIGEKYLKVLYLDDTESEQPIEKILPGSKLNDKGQLTLSNFKDYIAHLIVRDDYCDLI